MWNNVRKLLAANKTVSALVIMSLAAVAASISMGWYELSSRLGAVLVGLAVTLEALVLSRGTTITMDGSIWFRTNKPSDGNKSLSQNEGYISSKAATFLISVLAVLGTVLWAFGDWLTGCLHHNAIHCPLMEEH